MTYWDDDPGAELEALEAERLDADLEMAGLARAGNAIARAERAGRCCHGSTVGYRSPPFYPEQEGLAPGQSRCTAGVGGCARVFDSDDDWRAAMNAAAEGTE